MASSARFISTASKRSGLFISRWSSAARGANSFNTPIFGGIAQRWLSSYPAHEVVGMPSLSPSILVFGQFLIKKTASAREFIWLQY